jgi:TolA-binding protein
MTNEPRANPPRLSALPESKDALGVGRMFREARAIADEELPRLRWRLRTSQRLRAMRPRLVLRVALVVGVAFCMGGVVGAVVSPLWIQKERAADGEPAPAPNAAARNRKARAASALPSAAALPDPIPDESPAVAQEPTPLAVEPKPVAAPARHGSGVSVGGASPAVPPLPVETPPVESPPVEAPPPVVSSPIAVEQAFLGQAIRTLRDGHDARAALALLAQHADRFPQGAFSSEATVLRIEALLALGQRNDALALLDAASLASLPNQDEQRVVRGELRAASGRWREAQQDFDGVLQGRAFPSASPRTRTIQERALWGRAATRSRLDDEAGTRADLELYLRHFPAGQFAAAATSLLRRTP